MSQILPLITHSQSFFFSQRANTEADVLLSSCFSMGAFDPLCKRGFWACFKLTDSFQAELKPCDIFNTCPISVQPFYHVSAKCPFPLLPNTFFWRSGSASKYPRCSCFALSCFKVALEESKFSSACIQKHQHQLN